MKKLLIIIVIVLVIGIGVTAWFVIRNTNEAPLQQPPVVFPIGGSSTSSPTVSNADNFLQNPNVKEDSNNPGNYFIGTLPDTGNEVGNQPYIITYSAETKYFNITLTKEPIGQVRKSAESYLMQILSLSKEQMCSLDYSVYTPTSVNSQYAGTNLGFSFCAGAVKLP